MAATYAYLTATSQITKGLTKLKAILVADGSNTTVAIYNTPTASTSGTLVTGTMTFATTPAVITFTGDDGGVNVDKGLYVVLGGTNPKVTVVYDA